jgi:hypothetical protein
MSFDSIPIQSIIIDIMPVSIDNGSAAIDLMTEVIDNDSEAIDLRSVVIDNKSEAIDFKSEVIDNSSVVIDNKSEVLDNGSEVIDKKYNQINSKRARASNRTHPFAAMHICCPHEANAQNQRHQKSLPAHPSPPHQVTAALRLRVLTQIDYICLTIKKNK